MAEGEIGKIGDRHGRGDLVAAVADDDDDGRCGRTGGDGVADGQVDLRGLTIGGDDYLTKPFSLEELVARVQVILRRVGKARRTPMLTAGDLELDDDAHIVRKAGIEVALSPTEYKLLRFLLRNPGRALTRAQILDHVWDYDFDGESTVVETFVSSLRRKIDRAGPRGTKVIYTVRGPGYRLQAP